jgi:hypothetical protein
VEIIFWHTTRVLDEYRSIQPPRDPEDIDLVAIKTDLEFLMEQVARLPTRQESALKPLYVMIGSAGLVIAWFEIFLAALPLSRA